jgi:4'-phosphopantetheinyl transferase EntD
VRVDRVHGLFDDERVLVLAADVSEEAVSEIGASEAAFVARAIDKRKREFATGRVLARHAMRMLGVAEVEIPSGEDRAPIWPDEVWGSISHCDTRVVVAMGLRSEVGSVGIDVEHRGELKRDLWRPVFLPEEIEALEPIDASERGRLALVKFAAKEALYKAQYPISRTFMGFMALHVALEPYDARGGALACTFRVDVPPFAAGTVARGTYRLDAFSGSEIAAAIRIPEPSR